MDSVALILKALTTGRRLSMTRIIAETCGRLLTLIQSRFKGNPGAVAALQDYKDDPDTYEKPLRRALKEVHIERDEEALKLSRRVISLAEQVPVPAQKQPWKSANQLTGSGRRYARGDYGQMVVSFWHEREA